ncbi:glutamate ABC transporter substrate-binding protein [Tersicoccus sp. Bi-70]|uniref:glutamate ABC transporter substrate-binding protein n=1 Tax=Tersicoccus sp. Bi-70 TaxID=1897634 RepID=UPI00097569F4|nr:glutamate ABC transporter substrate-binding protein [Tersicoccus sp. Bi-70]OMH35102.1 ABC transporter substrate-binding protein [Tersicoccus sp. Bi-70]
MRIKATLLATMAASALALSACGGGGSGPGASGGDSASPAVSYPVASNVALTGSPTYDKIKSAGKVVIGVKEDQPQLGFKDAITGERSGFDVEIARWTASTLGISPDKIEFKAIPSAQRESALSNGDVNLYVGTYSITDKRKKQVDFAGPYFVTGQGLLVKKDSSITGIDGMNGKTACSVTGSTPIQNIKDKYKQVKTTEFSTYSECVDALKNGQADAVTTDEAILLGYAAQDPDNLKTVGKPFSTEKYGVGLPKGDKALRTFVNKMFTDGKSTWTKIYDATLGKSGTKVEQPAVENY